MNNGISTEILHSDYRISLENQKMNAFSLSEIAMNIF